MTTSRIRLPARLTGALCLVVMVGPACAPGNAPDLIIHEAKVFTSLRDAPWAEAVAVTGSRFVAVGTSRDILARAGPDTRVVDAGGRVLVAGFNDAHYHTASARPAEALQLGADPGLDEVLDTLEAAAARTPEGTWLTGTVAGSVFDDPRTTLEALDRRTPGHPVLLSGWTGHGRVVNTLARRAFSWLESPRSGGLASSGTDYSEGAILHGYPAFKATAQLQRGLDSTTIRRMAEAQDQALALGITSLQAMAYPLPPGVSLAALEAAGPRLRWSFIRFPLSLAEAPDDITIASPLVEMGGVKLVLDGTPEERYMLLRTPYEDRSAWTGRSYVEASELRTFLDAAFTAGEQAAIHAVGDSAIALLFQTLRSGRGDEHARVRLEHGDGLTGDLAEEAVELGVVVVQNPSHLTIGDLLRRRLGEDRTRSMQPLRTLVERGIPLALGSDGPLSPFLNIMFAVLHPSNPDEALSVEEAMIAYTWGSAYAQFRESEVGTIEEGKLADFAVLSDDIFDVPPDRLPGVTSLLTVVGGRIEHASEPFSR